jgi:hypothetical protein
MTAPSELFKREMAGKVGPLKNEPAFAEDALQRTERGERL